MIQRATWFGHIFNFIYFIMTFGELDCDFLEFMCLDAKLREKLTVFLKISVSRCLFSGAQQRIYMCRPLIM